MLIKRTHYKRAFNLFASLPGLKQYIQLLKFVHKQISLKLISKSGLIQKKPSDSFIQLCRENPCYFYLPWIEVLTNKLMKQLDNSATNVRLIPLAIFSDTHQVENRKKITFFAQYNNKQLNKIILAWLKPTAHNIRGFIFTFDYSLLQRQIIKICQQLAIPTILIPHESVFFNRDKYYFHPVTGINTPLCDQVLCWGQLQKDIFTSRGYPAERIQIVGAPKLDCYYNYRPQLSRQEFCRRAVLNSDKRIIMFTAQTLDFQVQHNLALSLQRKIISELIEYCHQKGCSFILRCPPTNYPIIDKHLSAQMQRNNFFIDSAYPTYSFEAEEALYHSDIIISINSTMLFEALLMGKKSLSVKYFDFNEDWQRAGIKCVFNKQQLLETLDTWLQDNQDMPILPTSWAIQAFSLNGFDGQSTKRITDFLASTAIYPLNFMPSAVERFINDEKPTVDLVYFPDLSQTFRYIPNLLNAKKIITHKTNNLQNWIDINCQINQKKSLSSVKHLPNVYIERGIIHFGREWTSITLDDLAYYNDTTKTTRLQTLLESKLELTQEQLKEAECCINKIISSQFPFDDSLLIKETTLGRLGKPKIVLIDEYMDSPNISIERYFKTMLTHAIQEYPDYDILIKPLAAEKKRKKTYLDQAFLKNYLMRHNNIYIIDPSYNIYELFKHTERLFVANSLMGFWGLMAGKIVHCYGSPFYANWGLTLDSVNLIRHKRTRTLAELFYFSCIYLSYYYSPSLKRKCTLSEYIDYALSSC